MTPTRQEIVNIIKEKKNNKSTPDFKNEMLKRPGEAMIDMLHPLVTTTWDKEITPDLFNKGFITSLHKGKGDKESLANHRGITTSSSIGTIFDSILDTRLEYLVKFTHAQGGGKKHSSTGDHLFILRAIIDISIAKKKPTHLTFYDVSKAYDNVDNDDLLVTMWDKGLRGKAWRILKNLNSNLSAAVKTRFWIDARVSDGNRRKTGVKTDWTNVLKNDGSLGRGSPRNGLWFQAHQRLDNSNSFVGR